MTPLEALSELLAVRQLRQYITRRKGRRKWAIERDAREFREVAKLHAQCLAREAAAWDAARAIVEQSRSVIFERENQA